MTPPPNNIFNNMTHMLHLSNATNQINILNMVNVLHLSNAMRFTVPCRSHRQLRRNGVLRLKALSESFGQDATCHQHSRFFQHDQHSQHHQHATPHQRHRPNEYSQSNQCLHATSTSSLHPSNAINIAFPYRCHRHSSALTLEASSDAA